MTVRERVLPWYKGEGKNKKDVMAQRLSLTVGSKYNNNDRRIDRTCILNESQISTEDGSTEYNQDHLLLHSVFKNMT